MCRHYKTTMNTYLQLQFPCTLYVEVSHKQKPTHTHTHTLIRKKYKQKARLAHVLTADAAVNGMNIVSSLPAPLADDDELHAEIFVPSGSVTVTVSTCVSKPREGCEGLSTGRLMLLFVNSLMVRSRTPEQG